MLCIVKKVKITIHYTIIADIRMLHQREIAKAIEILALATLLIRWTSYTQLSRSKNLNWSKVQ